MEGSNRRMDSDTRIVEAPIDEARSWIQYSLKQGFDLAEGVLAEGFLEKGKFLAIVSTGFQRTPFSYESGGVVGQRVARERLVQILEGLARQDGRAVLVEDSTAGRNDPHLSHRGEPSAFIGERVIHWCDLSNGGTPAMEVVAWGTSGYPTNAFVVSKASQELGLSDRQDAPNDLAQDVVSSLMAVIVAAFDAESYLLWLDDSAAVH